MADLTRSELEARMAEIKARLKTLDDQYPGALLPEAEAKEWNELNDEYELTGKTVTQLIKREKRVTELFENEDESRRESGIDGFQTRRPDVVTGEAIYDLTTIRTNAGSPNEMLSEMRDRAMRSVEQAHFPAHSSRRENCQGHVALLLDTIDGPGGEDKMAGELARRILVTGSEVYKRAFAKKVGGRELLDNEETRALSVGTGSAGGFAVVYTLDPTIIPTSNWVVNPWRAISSVEQIAGTNEWRGVTSGAVTATRVAEGTEATDNAPTLSQPALIVTKVHTFIPYSIEIGQDAPGLISEMARLIADAKDVEESAAYATGNGTTPNPQGVITGATNTTAAGGVASYAVADVYKVWEALPARFRPNARWVANLFTYDKTRQFDTAGGASLFIQNLTIGSSNDNTPGTLGPADLYATLLGKPAYESTDMVSVLTTGSKIAIVGDFSYYKIVDRIGMDVELVPQLFGATSRYPTGQRGLYAYWRNYAKVLSPAAFQVLVTS